MKNWLSKVRAGDPPVKATGLVLGDSRLAAFEGRMERMEKALGSHGDFNETAGDSPRNMSTQLTQPTNARWIFCRGL